MWKFISYTQCLYSSNSIHWTTAHTHTHRFECRCTINHTGRPENLPRFPHCTTQCPALYPRERGPHEHTLRAEAQLNHEGKCSCWEHCPHRTNSCICCADGEHQTSLRIADCRWDPRREHSEPRNCNGWRHCENTCEVRYFSPVCVELFYMTSMDTDRFLRMLYKCCMLHNIACYHEI